MSNISTGQSDTYGVPVRSQAIVYLHIYKGKDSLILLLRLIVIDLDSLGILTTTAVWWIDRCWRNDIHYSGGIGDVLQATIV